MSDRKYTLTRRRLLAGVATLGAGSAATGAGTYAAFSDTERASVKVSSGTLNLTVDGGSESLVFLERADLRSGASGSVTLPLRNAGTIPGYLDVMVERVTDTEGNVHEPGDDSTDGELAERLTVTASLTGSPVGRVVLCSPDQPFEGLFTDNTGETFGTNYELPGGSNGAFTIEWTVDTGSESAITGDAASVTLAFELSESPQGDGTASCPNDEDGGDNGGGDEDGDEEDDGTSGSLARGIVFTRNQGTLSTIAASGESIVTPGADANNVVAIGPATDDFDGDGEADVPFLKNDNSLRLVDADGGSRKYVVSGKKADTQKTVLAVGTWEGTRSVFYPGKGNDGLYRLTPGEGATLVADPGQGVSAVLGPGDIDGDGSDELLFVDDSKYVKYVETDGEIKSTGEVVGSDNSVGAGPPATFDGDVRAPIVDDSNRIHLLGPGGITSTLLSGSDSLQARKAAVAATDIDGDGEPEVVFLDNAESKLRYVDDVTNSENTQIRDVTDDSGNAINADDKRGVLPGHTSGGASR